MTEMTVSKDAVVIGGGISGLSTAYYLKQAGFDVAVLEKGSETGGTIKTKNIGQYLAEFGPNGALETTPLIRELCEDLGIMDSFTYSDPTANRRYILRDKELRALPVTPFSFMRSHLFTAGGKLRILRELFVRPAQPWADESVSGFVRRRLGDEFLDYAVNPFVSGVFAGRPEDLSVRSSFPKLHELEQEYGSILRGAVRGRKKRKKEGKTSKNAAKMFSFTGGMGTLIDALSSGLDDGVFTDTHIESVSKAGSAYEVKAIVDGKRVLFHAKTLVMAIPAHAYESIQFVDIPVPSSLNSVPYAPVSVVFVGYDQVTTSRELDGFGFLIPEKEDRKILGAIWNSSIFPNRAPQGGVSITAFVGGMRQPELAGLPDEQLVAEVRGELEELLGITGSPSVSEVYRWDKAIPQYDMDHGRAMRDLDEFESRHPGLHIVGNFRGGISIGDCVEQAHRVSGAVIEDLTRFVAPT